LFQERRILFILVQNQVSEIVPLWHVTTYDYLGWSDQGILIKYVDWHGL